jgi:hypothetical protein
MIKRLALAIAALAAAGCTPPETATEAPAAETACPPGALCDDFESYAAGAPPAGDWIVDLDDGAATIETARAFSGAQAVRLTSGGDRRAFIAREGAPLFPATNNTFYGRMMVFLESAPQTNVHWTMIEARGHSAQGDEVELRYGGQHPIFAEDGAFAGSQLMANFETPEWYGSGEGPKTDCWRHAAETDLMPTDRWACVAFAFDGARNEMRFWLDGAPVPELTVQGVGQGCVHQPADYPWRTPAFDRINLGWESYQDDPERTLWIDDVALGPEPLACPVGSAP